ncbi:MAG: Hsp20 family protein [candidate division Zixibacteria bacterium]|nr:Hsp20 family protein [candidate division Zixibacteria bacterium]
MVKNRRLKGIHDIVTTVHKLRRKDDAVIDAGGTGSGGFGSADESLKKVNLVSPRTWVFSTRPKFTRHQKPIEKSLLVEKVEEPRVNVFKEIKEVVVLAEMPGADKESISCKIKDDILFLSAEAKDSWGAKKYEKEILLPCVISPGSLKTSYENQILEIKLKRKENWKSKKSKTKKRR